jgi:acyl carrier protein
MTREEVFEKVADFLYKQLAMKGDYKVLLDSDLVNDLGVDSLDAIELWLCAEEISGLDIPQDDLKTVKTVREVVEYIYGRMEEVKK